MKGKGTQEVGMFGKYHNGRGAATLTGWGSNAWKPAVVEGRIESRQILNLTVVLDHYMVDGALAASFTRRLAELIECGYGLSMDPTPAAMDSEPAAMQAV